MTQCENCIHKKICDLWEEIDGADACCYSLGDTCYYFDGIEDTRSREEELTSSLKALESNDLIRRSQTYEALTKQAQLTPSVVRRVLLQVPTVDAVEVVRCKDCIHREDIEGWGNSAGYCVLHSAACCGYCEDGKRKEGADNT